MSNKHQRYTEYKKENNINGTTEIANAFYMGYGHGFADSSEEIKMNEKMSDEKLNYWYGMYCEAVEGCKKRELIIATKDEQIMDLENRVRELEASWHNQANETDKWQGMYKVILGREAGKDEQLLKLKEALVKVSLHCECFRFEERYPIQETIREVLEKLKGEVNDNDN